PLYTTLSLSVLLHPPPLYFSFLLCPLSPCSPLFPYTTLFRSLELQVQLAIRDAEGASATGVFNIDLLRQVTLNQFHGIELEEFPARIAQTALHLTDHKANMEMAAAFGEYVPSLPLSNSATITTANALRADWAETLPAEDCTYLVGNPPFVGLSWRSDNNTTEMKHIWGSDYHGTLDYVTSWYRRALDYM